MTVRYTGHIDRVQDAVFSNKNKHLVTVSDDGVLRMYETDTGKSLYAFFNHRAEQFVSVAAKSDDSMIIAANANGMLYILEP